MYMCIANTTIFVLISYYPRFESLEFEQEASQARIQKTSRDHLLVQDSSRLSIKISGILGRN